MLEKRKVISKIEVEANGTIFLKELNQILDNGQVVSSIPHRTPFTPDMPIESLPDVVKPHAEIAWTNEIKAAFEAQKAAQER